MMMVMIERRVCCVVSLSRLLVRLSASSKFSSLLRNRVHIFLFVLLLCWSDFYPFFPTRLLPSYFLLRPVCCVLLHHRWKHSDTVPPLVYFIIFTYLLLVDFLCVDILFLPSSRESTVSSAHSAV